MARPLVPALRLLPLALVLLSLSAFVFCPLTVCPGAETQRAQTMQAPGTGNVNVTVTDNSGRPVSDARVMFNGSAAGITDSDGTLTIHDVIPNETGRPYLVWANRSGYLNSTVELCIVSADATTNVTLELEGSTILGTVTGPSGGLVGATVSIFELGLSVVITNADGSYGLVGVRGGPRSVMANATGYIQQTKDVVLPVGESLLLNFVLSSLQGSVSGHVYHSALLTPLNNTNISIQIGATTLTVVSDSAGSYNITNVPEGTYSLTASREGFFSSTLANVAVTRGNETEDVDFYLQERPTRLYGVVRSGTLLLAGVNVTIEATTYYNISGADGSYEIRNLTAGAYTVKVAVTGYETALVTGVVIPSGGEVQVNINLVALPGAILRGVVTASDSGDPLANVFITIVDSEPSVRSTLTNIMGEFEFTGLSAGNYTLRFERTGYRPMEVSKILVQEDAVTNRTFEMTPLRRGFEGFIFGFDMAHSMMILALFLTIVILAMAVYLRIRTFQAPETAPAVYDQAEEEAVEGGEKKPSEEVPPAAESEDSDSSSQQTNKVRRIRQGGT